MGTEITGPVDYQAVLADLRARRDQIDQAIAAIEVLATGQPAAGGGGDGASGGDSKDIREDEFFGMSITEATKKYLTKRKKALTTQEIAEALDKGGLAHTSENWGNTVGSVLTRSDKSGGEIVRVKRGTFGLAAWYPNRRKSAINDKGKPDNGKKTDEEIDPLS